MAVLRSRGLFLRTQWSFLAKHLAQTNAISTSSKKKDIAASLSDKEPCPKGPQTAEEFADVKSQKNWISYGYNMEDKAEDRSYYHTVFFTSVTLCIVGGGFIFMYMPDFRNRDWTVREAYLELHRREKLGLPLIDKNLIDPSLVELPDEELLGDTEIII